MHKLVVTNGEGAARAIAHGVDSALQKGLKVLWLWSGGSNGKLQIKALSMLKYASRHNLTISLIDERFVALESTHSNWHQLLDSGLNGERARLEPPIIDWNLKLYEAAHDWAVRLGRRISEADMVIGQFGIGADGHTAGILPQTEGVHEHDKLVLGYRGKDFDRLTTTPALFSRLHLAIAVAMGESKKPMLEAMQASESADEVPAKLLQSASELIIYTDQKVEWT